MAAAPETADKLPGYLSQPAGCVRASAHACVRAYGAFCELLHDLSPGIPAAAGDFGFKVLTSSGPAEIQKIWLVAEITNGRLATMAAACGLPGAPMGSACGDWALYTASPLCAFENELGVKEPAGWWDPAGFTADGSDGEVLTSPDPAEMQKKLAAEIATILTKS